MTKAGDSVDTARRALARAFTDNGLDSPSLDAKMLLIQVTGLTETQLLAGGGHPLSASQATALSALAARRLTHEPMARILGMREFYGRTFHLNDACLIPRPDTETLIDAVLARTAPDAALTIADFGTGPGTILLTLLAERPRAFGVGVDLSFQALCAAHDNAARLSLSPSAAFVQANWDAPIGGSFDIVVANPPYITTRDMDGLQEEVKRFDPVLALHGGTDGLAPYRILFAALRRLLKPRGLAAMEFGIGQDVALAKMANCFGFDAVIERDLGGLPRVIILRDAGLFASAT